MTEAIKQWIADQTLVSYPDYKGPHEAIKSEVMKLQETYAYGLTKGIEIAEGFAEYCEDYFFIRDKKKWMLIDDNFHVTTDETKLFTTSQLLEKYLIYLKTLEP